MLTIPSTEALGASQEVQGTTHEVQVISLKVHGTSYEVQEPSHQIQGTSDEVQEGTSHEMQEDFH